MTKQGCVSDNCVFKCRIIGGFNINAGSRGDMMDQVLMMKIG